MHVFHNAQHLDFNLLIALKLDGRVFLFAVPFVMSNTMRNLLHCPTFYLNNASIIFEPIAFLHSFPLDGCKISQNGNIQMKTELVNASFFSLVS